MTNQGHEQFSRAGNKKKMHKNKQAHEKSPQHIYMYMSMCV